MGATRCFSKARMSVGAPVPSCVKVVFGIFDRAPMNNGRAERIGLLVTPTLAVTVLVDPAAIMEET
jgi:hypothetical protein